MTTHTAALSRHWYRKFSVAVTALYEQGWYVDEEFWPSAVSADLEALVIGATVDDHQHHWASAALGKARVLDPHYRNDRIRWLQPQRQTERDYLALMELYRRLLNRRLYLGLQDYECHYACYEPGGFYKRHLDGFRDARSRLVTTVNFLNSGWDTEDGGELVIYDPASPERELIRVLPRAGTFVSFLSEEFPHEVLPGRRSRASLTGWFRMRAPL